MKQNKRALRAGGRKLTLGEVPRVVGVITSLRGKFQAGRVAPACDLVEVRLDLTGQPSGWLERCKEIQAAGLPVLLTIRLAAEGGKWVGPEEERLALFERAMPELAAVDVELRCEIVEAVARMAKKWNKVCVISHHDFERTLAKKRLEAVIRQAGKLASVVKISTRINDPADEQVLRSLLETKWEKPLCVIGMGTAWAHTRVLFPKLGSCLAYGYLGKATAPGQFSAAVLTRELKKG